MLPQIDCDLVANISHSTQFQVCGHRDCCKHPGITFGEALTGSPLGPGIHLPRKNLSAPVLASHRKFDPSALSPPDTSSVYGVVAGSSVQPPVGKRIPRFETCAGL